MLISCVLQCTDGLRLIKRLENYAYRMSEKTAYRSLEKSAYRSLKKLLTVHLQIHLTACTPGHDSGTFDYFTEAVNGKGGLIRQDNETVKIFFSEDDNALVTGVAGDAGSIGYFGFAYYEENADKLKLVPIQKADAPVTPSFETISNSSYPLSRPLFIYVNKESLAREEVNAFVTFYLENAGELASEVGYVALPDALYTEALAKLD